VTVGAVIVTASTRSAPPGVRDSKELTAVARLALVPAIERWADAHAVGHASAEEIDAVGLMAALRRAARRALSALGTIPDAVLLDGNHDYLSVAPNLLDEPHADGPGEFPDLRVITMVKADRHCAGVAAASVLAKVARDQIMAELARAHPAYGWEVNKGYATAAHLDALARLGACAQHRRSWRLPVPGLDGE